MIPAISDEQRALMNEQGYFVLENVFTRTEMDSLAEKIEQYQRKHEEAVRARGGTEGISRADEITFTAFLAENDEQIHQFVTRPEFVAIATQLLGPDVDLYWNQSVFKQPEGKKIFPWHQDDGYTPVEPSPYLTLWLALNDATPENGCISVLPGAYKRGLLPHKRTDIGLVCHDADDPDQGVLVPVSAGSLAVFWSLTPHKSGANVSKGPRKAYVIQYSKAGLKNAHTGETLTGKIPLARGGAAVSPMA
jgi:ectoine hydroxylase-related dioxygenase (phytanoyl-CoA dioxygenase family)